MQDLHEMEGYPNTKTSIVAKLVDLDRCRAALNCVITHQSNLKSNEVEEEAKRALWHGLTSSPHGLCEVLQLWQTEMEFKYMRLPDWGPYLVYLKLPNSSDPEVVIGKCASLKDVFTMEAALQSCKFDFADTIQRASWPSFGNPNLQASSDVEEVEAPAVAVVVEEAPVALAGPVTEEEIDAPAAVEEEAPEGNDFALQILAPSQIKEVANSSHQSEPTTTLNTSSQDPSISNVKKTYYRCCSIVSWCPFLLPLCQYFF